MNLDELERLYREATPGEWVVKRRVFGYPKYDGGPLEYLLDLYAKSGVPIGSGTIARESDENQKLIAALHNAFPALLALARDGERYREMEQKMRAFADAEYVLGIDIATYSAACQGSEAKLASGTFGAKELKAHEKMNRHFGAHFGIHAAIDAARKGEK